MDFPYKVEVSSKKMKAWITTVGNQLEAVFDSGIEEWLVSLPMSSGIKEK